MPLLKGKKAASREGISKNIKRELAAGKPLDQARAIALDVARRGGANIPRPKKRKRG